MQDILVGAFGAFLAALGFGVLFNIQDRKKLLWCGINGGIGGLVYELCIASRQVSEMNANFLAAVAFTLVAEVLARKMKSPVTSFIVCALIPLVPGGTMYDMMIEVITNDPYEALVLLLKTLSIAGLLALGILVVEAGTALFYRIIRKGKKYEKNN